MHTRRRKWYVVWVGTEPGVCDTWEECQLRTKGYPGARYKSFSSSEEAVMAYRNGIPEGDGSELLRAIASAPVKRATLDDFPEIIHRAIAVDAACSKNPGPMEYRGVDLTTGFQVFHQGPFAVGTNNIGEFLAIVHALALLYNRGDSDTVIYSDSRNAILWVRKKKCNTKLPYSPQTAKLLAIVERAEKWLETHKFSTKIYKWQTEQWGEVPADFGRKGSTKK